MKTLDFPKLVSSIKAVFPLTASEEFRLMTLHMNGYQFVSVGISQFHVVKSRLLRFTRQVVCPDTSLIADNSGSYDMLMSSLDRTQANMLSRHSQDDLDQLFYLFMLNPKGDFSFTALLRYKSTHEEIELDFGSSNEVK